MTSRLRNIYYYRIYTMDKAANVVSADDATERATNYYLGDFGSGDGPTPPGSTGYDAAVTGFDLGWFTTKYWMGVYTPFLTPTDHLADIGPTDATNRTFQLPGNRYGIPHPDGQVEFEDLMIFSMNYWNAWGKAIPQTNAPLSSQFALNMQSQVQGDELVVTVNLENNGTSVKGASLALQFDPQYLQVKHVESGTLFGAAGTQAFFASKTENGLVRFDASTLGTDRTVEYSGDIATIRFDVLRNGNPGLGFTSVKLRDGGNRDIPVQLKTTSVNTPSAFALSQNYPNPFTPSTVIGYQVAKPSMVTIDVYNTLGAKVATVVSGMHAAGSYQAQLDASALPSGLYYYTMRAGSFTATRSMTLNK
jgi:hypothetical protein